MRALLGPGEASVWRVSPLASVPTGPTSPPWPCGCSRSGRGGEGQEDAVGFTGAAASELKDRPAVCGGLMLGLAHAAASGGILADMSTSQPRRRWFHPEPAWLVYASFLVTGILFFSERWQWFPFNAHKGWTVLVAVGVVLHNRGWRKQLFSIFCSRTS